MSQSFLDNLNWRFATKQFDSEKKVSEEDLQKVLEAIRLTPTSFGLQPFHVYVVQNPETKAKLKEAGFNQSQFEDASHVLVFCTATDLEDRVEALVKKMTGGSAEVEEKLSEYIHMLRGFVSGMDELNAKAWADRQTYLALGFGLAACAELQIDSCPMEGFMNEHFDEILQLPENMKSVSVLSIGYRKEDPLRPKMRLEKEELFTKK